MWKDSRVGKLFFCLTEESTLLPVEGSLAYKIPPTNLSCKSSVPHQLDVHPPTTSSHIVMSDFTSNDLVLVTGANGHVAQHVVDQLLQIPNGPRVRGTVRREATVNEIKHHYEGKIPAGRLEVVVVEDLTAPGAFDAAMTGASYSFTYPLLCRDLTLVVQVSLISLMSLRQSL